jgi:hypothetical protein
VLIGLVQVLKVFPQRKKIPRLALQAGRGFHIRNKVAVAGTGTACFLMFVVVAGWAWRAVLCVSAVGLYLWLFVEVAVLVAVVSCGRFILIEKHPIAAKDIAFGELFGRGVNKPLPYCGAFAGKPGFCQDVGRIVNP